MQGDKRQSQRQGERGGQKRKARGRGESGKGDIKQRSDGRGQGGKGIKGKGERQGQRA